MANRSSANAVAIIALIIGIAGLSLGGYILFFNNPPPENNPVARVYYEGETYNLIQSDYEYFNFNQISFDSHNAFDLETDIYRVPVAGYYQVCAQYAIKADSGDIYTIVVYVNGEEYVERSSTSSLTTNVFSVSVSDILECSAGDQIRIGYWACDNNEIYDTPEYPGHRLNYFSIARIR